MTPENFKHSIVANPLQHIERVGPSAQKRHLLETWSPGTVVPENRDDRQIVTQRRLNIPTADAQSSVANNQNDLLSRTRQLGADRHSHTVANRCQRTGVDDLAGE